MKPASDQGFVRQAVLIQEVKTGRPHLCPVRSPVVVGRVSSCQLPFQDSQLSREHCELYGGEGGLLRVTDRSTNGTFVNDVRVEGVGQAKEGDVIRLGPVLELRVLGAFEPQAPLRRSQRGFFAAPQRLTSRYLLMRGIARGGGGLVYEAWDREADKRRAIKVCIGSGPTAPPQILERFRREAALQASLSDYPGILNVLDSGVVPDGGELFLVMEYVDGLDLGRRIQEGLGLKEGLRLMARVARAVEYAHQRGVVHRDLKPANVLVTADGNVRLTDFGLGKALGRLDDLSRTGVMKGTPLYMAPEQINDAKRAGPLADVYSLGTTLYVILTGKDPYEAGNLRDLLAKVEEGDVIPPREHDPSLDQELNDLCLRSMARDPRDRPQSARELAHAIEDWLAAHNPPTRVKLKRPRDWT